MTDSGWMLLRNKTYGPYIDKMNSKVKQPQPTIKETLKAFRNRFIK